VFSLASLAGGLAQSETWLITARAVQGLGAAIVSPAALSIITTTFADGAERNRALGIWGAIAGAGGAAGVLLGGILTSGLNWLALPSPERSDLLPVTATVRSGVQVLAGHGPAIASGNEVERPGSRELRNGKARPASAAVRTGKELCADERVEVP
jgi:MFS family permease